MLGGTGNVVYSQWTGNQELSPFFVRNLRGANVNGF